MAKMQNVDRLMRRLTKLRDGPRKAMSAALQENAEDLVSALQRGAPVGHTGETRRSVGWAWGNAPGDATLGGGDRGRAKGLLGGIGLALTVFAGNKKAWYVRLREFGTRPHINKGLFPGTQNPGTPARPWFFPTYRLYRKRLLSRVSRAMRAAIKAGVKAS